MRVARKELRRARSKPRFGRRASTGGEDAALGGIDYQRLLRENAHQMRPQDVALLARHARALRPRAAAVAGSQPLLAARLTLLIDLLSDYQRRRYRKISFRVIAAAAFALMYFVSPYDVVPDEIPEVGYADDAAIVGLVFFLADEDLRDYSAWKGVVFPA